MEYSVLMAVYKKDNPQYFKEAIQSMINQTIITNDFVIVCDGPLTSELDDILKIYESNKMFNIIRLNENVGLGKALEIALPYCKNELVARMDSDDISLPERCEKQLEIFKNQDVSIVSGTVDEYTLDLSIKTGSRVLPEYHDEIVKFSKKRSPFNHPTVMFKKSDVISSGNYQSFHLHEDYYLWVRMLRKGFKGYNLQDTILNMRADIIMIKRRGGLKYFKSTKRFQKYLLKSKYISISRYLTNLVIRFISQVLIPTKVRVIIYNNFLRRKNNE